LTSVKPLSRVLALISCTVVLSACSHMKLSVASDAWCSGSESFEPELHEFITAVCGSPSAQHCPGGDWPLKPVPEHGGAN
jgi:hypothetical protein